MRKSRELLESDFKQQVVILNAVKTGHISGPFYLLKRSQKETQIYQCSTLIKVRFTNRVKVSLLSEPEEALTKIAESLVDRP